MTMYQRLVISGLVVIIGLLGKILLSLNGERFGDNDLANSEAYIDLVKGAME